MELQPDFLHANEAITQHAKNHHVLVFTVIPQNHNYAT